MNLSLFSPSTCLFFQCYPFPQRLAAQSLGRTRLSDARSVHTPPNTLERFVRRQNLSRAYSSRHYPFRLCLFLRDLSELQQTRSGHDRHHTTGIVYASRPETAYQKRAALSGPSNIQLRSTQLPVGKPVLFSAILGRMSRDSNESPSFWVPNWSARLSPET
mgnify:CR=1 FL=1